jgi:DNA-binding Lrp family transcriptional regulator
LIRTKHGSINNVAETLAGLPEISEVYSVGGSHDVVAIIRVRDNEQSADLETQKVVTIEHTETMIAFKAYSRYDLETVFSVGLER